MLLGVFDGHGHDGGLVADYVRRNLGETLLQQMGREKFKFDFKRAYKEAFFALDEHMHAESSFDDAYSGTTAITAFFKGDTMYVANIGDSRAIIGERRGARVIA